MLDEGYIKFRSTWIHSDAPPQEAVHDLLRWRNHLHRLGLIGIYPDGVGFGNVSVRNSSSEFIITGTQTGGTAELDAEGCTIVTDFDIDANRLTCHGPVEASSESLTHAAIYRCDESINAVVHVHYLNAWEALRHLVPTTQEDVPYGTPEMAHEIKRLFRESDVSKRQVLVMGGHREGIISFGRDLDEAGTALLAELRRWLG